MPRCHLLSALGRPYPAKWRSDDCVARGGGIEPPITGPEPVVLPITPPPNGCATATFGCRHPGATEAGSECSESANELRDLAVPIEPAVSEQAPGADAQRLAEHALQRRRALDRARARGRCNCIQAYFMRNRVDALRV